MSDTQDPVQDQLATLKARADQLNISYHPSIGIDKLREKIAAALSDEPAKPDQETSVAAVAEAKPETAAEERLRLKRYAHELIRIRVTCMNPAKKDHSGELFTVSNSVVGSITKFVPFNADDGWHVPRILFHVMQDRQCQIFVKGKSAHGVTQIVGKLIKEFAIEVLPQLTQEELHDLAQRQAMSGAID